MWSATLLIAGRGINSANYSVGLVSPDNEASAAHSDCENGATYIVHIVSHPMLDK